MLARGIRLARMTRSSRAAARTAAIQRHMSSDALSDEASVQFKEGGCLRTYVLNRPKKLNVLNREMLDKLRPKIEEWSQQDLVGVVAGIGAGRAFCAGGDVASVVEDCSKPETLPHAIEFFQREFEMDYILAAMPKPYIAVMDGITMGGGVGLSVNASFRIATENTSFAMPETKIGYCPDVGASFFLSRVDGEIGTYLGLTSDTLSGRAVFEHGFATHFVPSRRIPGLMDRISSLQNPTYQQIDALIEEHSEDVIPSQITSSLVGNIRIALDSAFKHKSVEKIIADLTKFSKESEHEDVRQWAAKTLESLHLRSPTSLKVALAAIRSGKYMTILEALQMELNIATAFCRGEVSKDFSEGVTKVVVEKLRDVRPNWQPSTINEVSDEFIQKSFFPKLNADDKTSPRLNVPQWLADAEHKVQNPMIYGLPTEQEIGKLVLGSHKSSGSTVLTLDELIAKLEEQKKGKSGVRAKVTEVVQRKCTTQEDKQSGKKWLKWIH
ncbi:3-hydroxyisobutyryl-coenzyme A hydrolase [Rhodofomes roseus]|uniref:3-hydroxyisobutyryl-CoA hydrolase n=1 Tax=Rhodofomes roseus TaxID=34475 RepID=A0ABQ8K6Q1_9APHY|nr:3-hydroxyisobutyryl-coenzyme A hydrolase [Rhodofomes roseus]KAH9832925.1 3-hydroxyisobutyryl-coenzyme A hydrolase [Rhodofomes roseus]